MAENWILGYCDHPIPSLFLVVSCLLLGLSSSSVVDELGSYNTYTVSSFRYPETTVRPYDARYIRVDLPQWFSSISIAVESDVDLDSGSVIKTSMNMLPLICFREGSPPVPDFLNSSYVNTGPISNISFEEVQDPQTVKCYAMEKSMTLRLTNEQPVPSPEKGGGIMRLLSTKKGTLLLLYDCHVVLLINTGVWYLGLFNGIGPTRTQSKMIVRSPAYSFRANISVEGCASSTMWGQYCNQTVYPLSCSQSDRYNLTQTYFGSNNQTFGASAISCFTTATSCQVEGEPRVYSLDVLGITEKLVIMALNATLPVSVSYDIENNGGANLMLFARLGALPSVTTYDYSHDIIKSPLVIQSPKVGRWFITAVPGNLSTEHTRNESVSGQLCYSIGSQLLECPVGKAGDNCTSRSFRLQTVLRKGSPPFESFFLPISQDVTVDSANFPLESLSSNFSNGGEAADSWTYFVLDIPPGAAGGNIHIQLSSSAKINYEVYTRFGGLPSLDNWDYYYANRTRSSDGSMFFMLYNSSEDKVDFYIVYVKEGTWSFGLRHLNTTESTSDDPTAMSVSVERCPKRCSSHGDCGTALDASGLTSYSFCSCDRTHGGFDCSVEIISHQGHIWQSIALIGSNAAALLPALWSLRKKEFAEWILFTSSGISSALYHACDVGTWCVLSFGVLQFMDFWLSFMAVVSTFVYLTTIDEPLKRTVHTAVAILTALLAITKATRSSNIVLVMAIGATGLLIGWMVEFSTKVRLSSFSVEFCLNITTRWQMIREWVKNLTKTVIRRFRWGFVLAGFVALAMAGISWKLESSESYWVWHSLWHVSIYTSSFLFLCSKADTATRNEENRPLDESYALTRQDSLTRS